MDHFEWTIFRHSFLIDEMQQHVHFAVIDHCTSCWVFNSSVCPGDHAIKCLNWQLQEHILKIKNQIIKAFRVDKGSQNVEMRNQFIPRVHLSVQCDRSQKISMSNESRIWRENNWVNSGESAHHQTNSLYAYTVYIYIQQIYLCVHGCDWIWIRVIIVYNVNGLFLLPIEMHLIHNRVYVSFVAFLEIS